MLICPKCGSIAERDTIGNIVCTNQSCNWSDYIDNTQDVGILTLVNAEDIGFCKDEVTRCIIFETKTQILLFTVSVKEK